ncbi:MAG: hypothetical protein KJ574_02840 [Nanoarchaeota archaeon]|nr:hypothetical protein [Nanoarchaeota archaeon]
MSIVALALFFYIILVILGFITIWLGFPGTMLIIGGAIVYDLFTRSTTLPWQAYIAMFTFLAIGEIADIVMASYLKKSQTAVNFLKTVIAIGMVVVFVLTF